MHALARTQLGRGLRVVLVVLGLLAMGAITTTAAYAHDSLIDSTPGDGEALQEAPSEVELVFSGNIGTDFAQVSVMSADGTDHADGEPVIEGDTLTQPVSDMAEGEYEVGFRIVSSDGHPVEDSLTFSVESAAGGGDETPEATDQAQSGTEATEQATEQAETDEEATEDTTPAAGSAADESDDQGPMPWAIGALVAILVVIGIVGLLIRRKRRSESSTSPGSQGSPDNTA